MTARRFVSLLCLAALAFLCAGCATVRPAHLTIFCEGDRAEAENSNGSRQRTVTGKTGASLTWDLR